MAGVGNPKGSNGGGGMRKGQSTRKTVERKTVAAKEAAVAEVKAPRTKLAREILSDAMVYFFGLAARYQPSPTNGLQDEKKFEKYLDRAADIAGKLAPYQSPRLSSVAVTEVPMDLSRLTDKELRDLERLHAKATLIDGNSAGAGTQTVQ